MMRILIFVLLLAGVMLSCSRDSFEERDTVCTSDNFTYQNDIFSIISSSCSYSGCHDGGQNSIGEPRNSYEEWREYLDSGSFQNRTLVIRDMPPQYSPADRPKELSQEDFDILTCWIEQGYPK